MTHGLLDADRHFVDSLVVPATLHDIDGKFVHVNEAAERASGRSNAEWLGRHFTYALPPEERAHVAAHFLRALEQGEPTDFETSFHDAAGNLRSCLVQYLPLRRNGS